MTDYKTYIKRILADDSPFPNTMKYRLITTAIDDEIKKAEKTKKPTELDLAVCLQLIPEHIDIRSTFYDGYNQALRDTRKAFEDYFANNS